MFPYLLLSVQIRSLLVHSSKCSRMIELISGQIRGRFITSTPCCAPCSATTATSRIGGAIATHCAPAGIGLDWGSAPHHKAPGMRV